MPKTPNTKRCQSLGNIGVIGPERKNKSNNRLQKITQRTTVFAFGLKLNREFGFNVSAFVSANIIYKYSIVP